MRTVPVLTGAEAAQLIADSDVITVSSSSALGCPDAVLEAIGERYAETGSPADLTSLHPIAAGDMYGLICAGRVSCAACWPAPIHRAARSSTRR